ncbi:hypothetical protein SUDANB171_03601 [Streptomyces sp. enrichment culture]|uniref:hypothetical protein n=1 Tax=Streptomyces xiamenensis TaxID=408015 RepID=UPI0036E928F4
MIRDLYNVRAAADGGATDEVILTPMSPQEEQRARVAFMELIARELEEKSWARFPAYSPEERTRLTEVARALCVRLGRPVRVDVQDPCSMLFSFERGAGDPGQLDVGRLSL